MAFAACMTLAMGTPYRPQHVVEMAPAASVSWARAGGCVPAGLPPEGVAYARMVCRQISRWVPRYAATVPRPPIRSNENSVVRRYVPHLRRAMWEPHSGGTAGRGRSERVALRPVRERTTVQSARRGRAAGLHILRRASKPVARAGHKVARPAPTMRKPPPLGPVASGSVTHRPGQAPVTSQISRARESTQPGNLPRLPIMLIVFALLGISMLVLGMRQLPALVRSPRSGSLRLPVRERFTNTLRARRDISPTPASVVAKIALPPDSDVVRRVDGIPNPGEPLQGWSCAGPIVLDVASAGGVIGVCGAGVVRAALGVLAASGRHTVIITADCLHELYGGRGRPERVTVARTLDEAIGLVHAESVGRIRAEEDGLSQRDARGVWLCARADAQQARLRSLFEEAAEHGVHAVLLGYWPFGLSLTVDDDGRVLSAPSTAEQLTGSYLTTLPLETGPAETSSVEDTAPESALADPALSETDPAPARAENADAYPQLTILGPEGIKADGAELPGLLERRFSWEVATYLACHPEGAAADTIIEELWPNEPLMSARKRFTDAVYHLRKALRSASCQPHEKFVLLRMNRYRLDESQLSVDLWEFESVILASRSATDDRERLGLLRRAAELYRGEFAYVGDGLWAESFRHDLRRKAVGALDEAASLVESDNPSMAITMLEDAGRITPWAEEVDRHIMRIYQRLGRADDARNVYETLRERLRRLGEEPGAETRELLQGIVVTGPEG